MRPEYSKPNNRCKQKVLVLGERATSRLIAEQLESEGLSPCFEEALCRRQLPNGPNWGGFQNLAEIREILAEFASLSEGSGLIHPGTTLCAERPELTSIAEQLGMSVISPSVGILSLFGNKLNFLSEAERLGISNLVLSSDPMHTVREIEEWSRETKQLFPFVLRAAKGGGRFGRFLVKDSSQLEQNLKLWCDQLRYNYGEVILFAEKSLESARQISVPFVRFREGRVQLFPMVDASLQSSGRKVIEFCPAFRIEASIRRQLSLWTQHLAEKCGYVGLGVLEYLVDGNRAFIIDGIPRLNTGFSLWEKIAGTQAVSWQLAALKGNFPIDPPTMKNQWDIGLSARVYAEDSLYHFPQPGYIEELDLPKAKDSSVSKIIVSLNYEIRENLSLSDSGLFALIFVISQDKKQLWNDFQKILSEFWVSGSFQTNERFLAELLEHPWLKEGIFHTEFIDEEFLPTLQPQVDYLRASAWVCSLMENRVDWIVGDKRLKLEESREPLYRWLNGPNFSDASDRQCVSGVLEGVDKMPTRVCAYPLKDRWLIRIGVWYFYVRPRVSLKQGQPRSTLNALVTGRIQYLLFRAGVNVPPHEALVVVECMGVFVPHALPVRAKIVKWNVKSEDVVMVGQELGEIEVERR